MSEKKKAVELNFGIVLIILIILFGIVFVVARTTGGKILEEIQNGDEEEIKVEAQNKGDVSIEATTDILRGQNTITITAVDTEGNKNSIQKNFDGRLKPEFDVHIEGNRLYMKISHDMGFEKVEFSVNGAEYVYDENFVEYDAQKQEIEYYFDLVEGENTVIIKAVSNEETEDTYAGKCNYTAE